jgi:hypothetical protein
MIGSADIELEEGEKGAIAEDGLIELSAMSH